MAVDRKSKVHEKFTLEHFFSTFVFKGVIFFQNLCYWIHWTHVSASISTSILKRGKVMEYFL